MKKSELFDTLVDKVSEVCEVCPSAIVSGCRAQSVVDARMLLVYYLRYVGLSNDDVALIFLIRSEHDRPSNERIKGKAKGIDRLYNCYRYRCKESFIFASMSSELGTYVRHYCHATVN